MEDCYMVFGNTHLPALIRKKEVDQVLILQEDMSYRHLPSWILKENTVLQPFAKVRYETGIAMAKRLSFNKF